MSDTVLRVDPLARLFARFAYENRIASLRRIRAFLALDAAAFSAAARKWGWERRRDAPSAARLSEFLAGFEPAVGRAAGEADATPQTRALTQRLRAFVAERLALYASHEGEGSGPSATTRDIVALTRCLKELLALEAKIDLNVVDGRGEGHGATMGFGAASDLAEIVALQIEQLARTSWSGRRSGGSVRRRCAACWRGTGRFWRGRISWRRSRRVTARPGPSGSSSGGAARARRARGRNGSRGWRRAIPG